MDVRPKFKNTMTPIECQVSYLTCPNWVVCCDPRTQVFLPSIQTFAISDRIPLHLQLIGSIESLRELLPSTSPLLLPSGDTQIEPVTIQVGISRQITIEVNGRRKTRTFNIGEGRLWPVPPSSSQKSGMDVSLDWQGQVKCGPQVRIGGFLTGHVNIKVGNCSAGEWNWILT